MAEAPWGAQGPPPPPVLSGNIPATRLKNEIGERRNEPPACVQNAMMTKDKKPFTYTPGGIDLSEIKSPRMARRIERNANAPGVGELPPGYMQSQQQNRTLPPSALAAMQPQLPVQVFPAGIPPPPPPPPLNAPPTVPMPPLPTKAVASNDGVFERPDMTQIIPENPMALLRKTPKVDRKTFLDELTEMEKKNPAQHIHQPSTRQPNNQQPLSPQPTLYPTKPQTQNYPQIQNQIPFSQSPYSTQTPTTPQMQSSPQTPQYNRQPSYTTQPQPYSSQTQEQYSQPPVALMAQQSMCDAPPLSPLTKTSNVNIGSLYIPPINQQSRPQQYKPPSPPTPPQRQPQSPQTPQSPIPKLNAAPKPWQQQRREPELPEWAQRPQQSPPKEETVQSAKVSVQPPRITPVQMPPPPARSGVEVVYVTQPEVYQHPGPNSGQRWVPPQVHQQVQRPQQQCLPSEMKGTRIIPIHIEGQSSGPSSPATPERNFNRQPSWTPTQSKSFKAIQKMNAEDEEMQVEHAPRTSQQFPADQFRRIDLNDHDKEFTSRVNQASQNSNQHRGNHIRTIPIQIEGDLQQHYVHPSQQTVEEPRKYMGSSIPSPAFRMVHAMSNSPAASNIDKQSCEIADKNGVAEISKHSPTTSNLIPTPLPVTGYLPNYFGPYWYDYYGYYYANYGPNEHVPSDTNPLWGYQYNVPPSQAPTPTQEVDGDPPVCSSCRNTPISFWNCYSNYYQGYESDHTKSEGNESYRSTPANFDYTYYWDPYYYSYFPTPPLQPAIPYSYLYPYSGEGYDADGSTDEISSINKNVNDDEENHSNSSIPIYCKPPNNIDFEDDKSETTIVDDREDIEADSESSSSEDKKVKEVCSKNKSNIPSIESNVIALTNTSLPMKNHLDGEEGDIHIDNNFDKVQYMPMGDNSNGVQNLDVAENSEETDDEEQEDLASVYVDEDQMPHVLSVIYEESERSYRESSIGSMFSECTLIEGVDENNDENDKEYEKGSTNDETFYLRLPLKIGRNEGIDSNVNIENLNLEYIIETDDDTKSTKAEERKFSYDSIDTVIENNGNLPSVTDIDNSDLISCNSNQSKGLTKNDTVNLSESNSSQLESEIDIYTDNDRDSDKSTDSDNIPDISAHTSLPDACVNETEEVDFWSQINTDEELIPRRQTFFNKYRDSMYSVEEKDSTIEIKAYDEVLHTSTTLDYTENSSNIQIENTKDTQSILTVHEDNTLSNHIINKHEEEVVTHRNEQNKDDHKISIGRLKNIDEHEIIAQKVDNIEIILDIVSNIEEEQLSTVDILTDTDHIEKIKVDECNISNTVITKKEIRETLEAPKFDLGLDDCFKSIQNHLKLTFEDLSATVSSEISKCNISETPYELKKSEINFIHILYDNIIDNNVQFQPNLETPKILTVKCDKFHLPTIIEIDVKICGNNSNFQSKSVIPSKELTYSVSSRNRSLSRSNSIDFTHQNKRDNTSNTDRQSNISTDNSNDFYVPTIKERIQALQNASRNTTPKRPSSFEIPSEVQTKDYVMPEFTPPKSPKTSKSSVKSIEYNSEDEIDSGVTSDMSRHISDTESESLQEIRKIIKYQRAATHSRLYKLLQDECEEEEEEAEEAIVTQCVPQLRKQSLSLPLKTLARPFTLAGDDESGFNSPASPITDKQINDLISNLLQNKDVELKHIPMEVLQAAAFKILRDGDVQDLNSSKQFNNYLSPLLDNNSTAAQTPQEFYCNNDYNQYYETWDMSDDRTISLGSKIPNCTTRCPTSTDSKNVSNSYAQVSDLSLESQASSSAS